MNKLILLAPLIAGIVEPVVSTGLSPNLLAGYSPLYFTYNVDNGNFGLGNAILNPNFNRSLIKIDYTEPDFGFIYINFDYYPSLTDYIDNYAVNIYVNNDHWNIQPIIYFNSELNNYELVFTYSEPFNFTGSYNIYVEPHTETGRTGFYCQIEAYDFNITDIKISFDILDLGELATYDAGYDAGYDTGYDAGYDTGYQEGENNALVNTSFVDFIVNAVGGFMDFEIFPNFSIGGLLGAFVAVFIAVILLRVFAGG